MADSITITREQAEKCCLDFDNLKRLTEKVERREVKNVTFIQYALMDLPGDKLHTYLDKPTRSI